MEYNLPLCTEKLAAIAAAMEEDVTCLNKYEAVLRAVDAVTKLRRDVGLPESLKEVGMPKEQLPNLARELVTTPEYIRPTTHAGQLKTVP